jgi:hypothetical protein
MESEDKRKHRRIASLNLSYILLDEAGKPVKQGMGRTLNLSESGILLETRFPVAAEHTVVLSIGLEDRLVDVTGRPVHVRSTDNGLYEIGIEFTAPDDRALQTIRHFVQSLSPER